MNDIKMLFVILAILAIGNLNALYRYKNCGSYNGVLTKDYKCVKK